MDTTPQPKKAGCSIRLFAVAAVLVGLIALLLPARSRSRSSVLQEQCQENLKSIGLALHAYHQGHGCFPPAYLADDSGRPMHSWRVLLLPYLGWKDVYGRYRFTEPWDSEHNRSLLNSFGERSPFRCRFSSRAAWGNRIPEEETWTTYFMLFGPNSLSDGPHCSTTGDVADGLSQTIAVIEGYEPAILWTEPRDITADQFLSHLATPVDGRFT